MAKKQIVDSTGAPLYLQISEERSSEYYHVRACVRTLTPEGNTTGVDDTYSDGTMWSGLRVSCQGDSSSRQQTPSPVYGWSTEYKDCWQLDLRHLKRMTKTLTTIEAGLEKLEQSRGYCQTFGAYVGRVAEVLGCVGIVTERTAKSREMSGQRWYVRTIGDGVTAIDRQIATWQAEGQPVREELAS